MSYNKTEGELQEANEAINKFDHQNEDKNEFVSKLISCFLTL